MRFTLAALVLLVAGFEVAGDSQENMLVVRVPHEVVRKVGVW